MSQLPPHSMEAEQAVIGGLMIRDSAFFPVSGLVSAADFYRQDHQTLFAAIAKMAMAGKPVDFITLTEHLRDAGKLDEAGGYSYVGTLQADTPSAANIEHHAKTVRDHATRRRVLAFAMDLQERVWTRQGQDLIGGMGGALESLLRGAAGVSRRFAEAVDDAEATITANKAKRKAGGVMGAPTGLPSLDHITGGFTGPRLIVVGARPGTGKTALLNQFAVHSACRDHAGLICSIEMGADELVIRAMATASQANFTRIMRGFDDEVARAFDAAAELGDLPLWIDTETQTIEGICAQIAAHKLRYGIKWAAVDHIGLVRTEQRFSSRNEQLGHISWNLKALAKRLNIPVVVLSQLSRKSESESRKPREDDLRDSGNIEQDADMIILLHTPPEERDMPEKRLEIGVVKNRAGPKCWVPAEFRFYGATQTIREICSDVRE